MKPNIFIGSSSEGLKVAELIKGHLDPSANCTMWTNAFEFNKSNFDNLMAQVAFYDYAVLIATADDLVKSRGGETASARDNVLFEFGMFAGGLGRSRVFFVVEKGIKIPTDLSGITLPFLPPASDSNFVSEVQTTAIKIEGYIKGKENTFDLGFLPSTALAYGYFVNFIERTVQRLLEDRADGKIFHVEGNPDFKLEEIKVTILIPDDLSNDMFKKVTARRLRSGWQKMRVDPKDVRDYDFAIDVSKAKDGLLHLVDIPLTLNALNKSIELYSQKSHIGKNIKEQLLEQHEIRNFQRTLEYLIRQSPITKGIVEIEVVDI